MDEDLPFTLSALESTDNDPDFLTNGNVTWRILGPSTDITLWGFEVSLTLDIPAGYSVNVTVSDWFGNEVYENLTIAVKDKTPPVAIAPNVMVPLGSTARLNGRGSTDNNPDFPTNATFHWTIHLVDEDVNLDGPTTSYRIEVPGNYSAELWVEDAAGNGNGTSIWIRVYDDVPPRAAAGIDLLIRPGETVIFDGGGSSDNHAIAIYRWTIGTDPPLVLEGVEVEHTFDRVGDHLVMLLVADVEGNEATDKRWVNVTAQRPEITVTSPSNNSVIGGAVTVMGQVSANFDTVELSYRVLSPSGEEVLPRGFIDISGPFSFSIDLTGLAPGDYSVEITVDDGHTPSNATLLTLIVPPDGGGNGDGSGDVGFSLIVILGLLVVIALVVIGGILSLKWKKSKGP